MNKQGECEKQAKELNSRDRPAKRHAQWMPHYRGAVYSSSRVFTRVRRAPEPPPLFSLCLPAFQLLAKENMHYFHTSPTSLISSSIWMQCSHSLANKWIPGTFHRAIGFPLFSKDGWLFSSTTPCFDTPPGREGPCPSSLVSSIRLLSFKHVCKGLVPCKRLTDFEMLLYLKMWMCVRSAHIMYKHRPWIHQFWI